MTLQEANRKLGVLQERVANGFVPTGGSGASFTQGRFVLGNERLHFPFKEVTDAMRYNIQHDDPKDPETRRNVTIIQKAGQDLYDEAQKIAKENDLPDPFCMDYNFGWCAMQKAHQIVDEVLDEEELEVLSGEETTGTKYQRGDHAASSLFGAYWDGIGQWEM